MEHLLIYVIIGVLALAFTGILFLTFYIDDINRRDKEHKDNLRVLVDINENLEHLHQSLNCIAFEFTGLREDLEERGKK